EVRLAHAPRLFRRNHSALERLPSDSGDIDASAIVRHLDDDLATLVEGAQAETAFRALPGGRPAVGQFESVIDAVAEEVRERILNRFDQRSVQFGVPALHVESNHLAALLCG